jgi:hypothetical protein
MMRLLKLVIDPEDTGGLNSTDPKSCPIAKALRKKGFIGVHVYGDSWSALKWGFIPVGGTIKKSSQEKHKKIARFPQDDYSVIEVELIHFYQGD